MEFNAPVSCLSLHLSSNRKDKFDNDLSWELLIFCLAVLQQPRSVNMLEARACMIVKNADRLVRLHPIGRDQSHFRT